MVQRGVVTWKGFDVLIQLEEWQFCIVFRMAVVIKAITQNPAGGISSVRS